MASQYFLQTASAEDHRQWEDNEETGTLPQRYHIAARPVPLLMQTQERMRNGADERSTPVIGL